MDKMISSQYSLEAKTTNMMPHIKHGETVTCNLDQEAAPGDFVVIYFKDEREPLISQLCFNLPKKEHWDIQGDGVFNILHRQTTPPRTYKMPMSEIKAVHKIVSHHAPKIDSSLNMLLMQQEDTNPRYLYCELSDALPQMQPTIQGGDGVRVDTLDRKVSTSGGIYYFKMNDTLDIAHLMQTPQGITVGYDNKECDSWSISKDDIHQLEVIGRIDQVQRFTAI